MAPLSSAYEHEFDLEPPVVDRQESADQSVHPSTPARVGVLVRPRPNTRKRADPVDERVGTEADHRTWRRRPAGVSGAALSQAVWPSDSGRSPSMGDSRRRRCMWLPRFSGGQRPSTRPDSDGPAVPTCHVNVRLGLFSIATGTQLPRCGVRSHPGIPLVVTRSRAHGRYAEIPAPSCAGCWTSPR